MPEVLAITSNASACWQLTPPCATPRTYNQFSLFPQTSALWMHQLSAAHSSGSLAKVPATFVPPRLAGHQSQHPRVFNQVFDASNLLMQLSERIQSRGVVGWFILKRSGSVVQIWQTYSCGVRPLSILRRLQSCRQPGSRRGAGEAARELRDSRAQQPRDATTFETQCTAEGF